MEKGELQKLLKDLEEEQKKLKGELGLIADENPEIKGDYKAHFHKPDSSDTADEKAQSVTEYERERAMEQDMEQRLKEVTETIEKIKKGEYGVCTNCSTTIQPKRLEAVPTARLCINCAEKASLI